MDGLRDKFAVVTGGSRGIGKCISRAFLKEGARVAIAARDSNRLQETEKELSELGSVVAIVTDVSREADVERLFERAVGLWGSPDILVNNAGFTRQAPLHEMSVEDWDAVIETNLRGAFLCTRAALRLMIPRKKGRIINIGSISASRVRPNSAPYSASKFGLVGLTHTTALEGRPHGISCGILHPGNVMTERRATGARGQDSEPMIEGDELARAAVAMAAMPDHVNVLEAIVMPLGQLYVGRG